MTRLHALRPVGVLAVVPLLVALLPAAEARANDADKPIAAPSVTLQQKRIAKLHTFSRQVTVYSRSHPRSGYASVITNEDTLHVTLWWKGAIPGAVESSVETARAKGVRVKVKEAPHSLRETTASQRAVVKALNDHDIRFSRVGPTANASA